MRRFQKGSASVDLVIISTFIIICVLMPITTMVVEKIVVRHTISRVVTIMEGTLYAVSESVSLKDLAVGDVTYDLEVLADTYRRELANSMASLTTANVLQVNFYPSGSRVLLKSGWHEMVYDTLHVELEIVYGHIFYKTLLNKESNKTIQFQYDLEIPKNR